MKLDNLHRSSSSRSGIALIMVLMVITVLGVIAFGFAKSMTVEVKLARNYSFDTEWEWLGRSGVEAARWVLAEHLTIKPEGNWDSLDQYWAGGPNATNESLNAINFPLKDIPIGTGKVSLEIIDLERFANINLMPDANLKLAMELIGADPTTSTEAVNSILDWIDRDDNEKLNGAETDYYLAQSPPYAAKNGPIDDLEELLKIKGVTPEMYYGLTLPEGELPSGGARAGARTGSVREQAAAPPFGLKDIFTPMSARLVNWNTATNKAVKEIQSLLDQATITSMEGTMYGLDGVAGTEDDLPLQNLGQLSAGGLTAQGAAGMSSYFTTRSVTFRVTVTVELNNKKRDMIAILRRNDQRDVKVLMQYWK